MNALIERIEKATARLEEIEKNLRAAKANATEVQTQTVEVSQTHAATETIAVAATAEPQEPKAVEELVQGVPEVQKYVEEELELMPKVQEFKSQVGSAVDNFISYCVQLGGPVEEQGKLVQELVKAQARFMNVAGQTIKPDMKDFPKLLEQQQKLLLQISDVKNDNRRSPLFNNLSAVAEGVGGFGWVAVEPAPAPFVKEMKESGRFYTNRVLKEHKGSNQTHVDWVNAFIEVLDTLERYVKQYYTTGLVWSVAGKEKYGFEEAVSVLSGQKETSTPSAAPAPSTGAPPPPPPPPPPSFFMDDDAKSSAPSDSDARAALNKQLNQGLNITSGLKKVKKGDKGSHAAPIEPKAATKADEKRQQHSATTKKPPAFELRDRKWVIENQVDAQIEVNPTDISQSVYIFNCINTFVNVKSKVNNVTFDDSKKSSVLIDSVVSSCDVVNCTSVEVQVLNAMPLINIDKTDGVQLYLPHASLDSATEIFTSKSSSINILHPISSKTSDPTDYKESFVPEQFKTVIVNNTLVTEVYHHT